MNRNSKLREKFNMPGKSLFYVDIYEENYVIRFTLIMQSQLKKYINQVRIDAGSYFRCLSGISIWSPELCESSGSFCPIFKLFDFSQVLHVSLICMKLSLIKLISLIFFLSS